MIKHAAEAYQSVQDAAERERILMEQLPQVRYIARRIHERLPRHVPFEDLVHAGVVGLIDALNKFDLSKQVHMRYLYLLSSPAFSYYPCLLSLSL